MTAGGGIFPCMNEKRMILCDREIEESKRRIEDEEF
jgi:hypothetical protein